MHYTSRLRIDPPWTELPRRRVGRVPPGQGTTDRFVLIGTDDAPNSGACAALIDRDETVAWQRDCLGIDGVVIDRIDNGRRV